MVSFYLQKIQNQLEAKRSKGNTGGLCEYHMLSQTSININWEIQQTVCFANQTCLLKYAAQTYAWMTLQHDGIGSMRFFTLCTQKNL